jgi:amino acid permease
VPLSRSYFLAFPIYALELRRCTVLRSSMVSVTEMAVFAPVDGSVSNYGVSAFTQSSDDSRASSVLAGRWVDPALGFAVSIYWFSVDSYLIEFRLAG